MKTLADLNIGNIIRFKKGLVKNYVVRAKGGKYLIAVSEGKGSKYTVIDTEEGFCGPTDRTFNLYNFKEQEGIDLCLSDFLEGKYGIKISQRHGAKVEEVLNMKRTLS